MKPQLSTWFSGIAAGGSVLSVVCTASIGRADLVLVENGESRAPIIVAADASPETRRAAACLVEYIKKMSGAQTPVIEALPDPVPSRAIWVGYQPVLNALFPKVKFDFQHPEEILIAANEKHLVIAGRDRAVNGKQLEFGTANAVYTFLQKHLDVRWLWPGSLGEDVMQRKTLTLAPCEYRYHPQLRGRRIRGITSSGGQETLDWARFQRMLLHSAMNRTSTTFDGWWERYHEAHPDYFALQPDGSRTPVSVGSTKICQANPAVWAQWLDNVAQALKADPTRELCAACPTDGHNSGICVCKDCRAWDVADAPIWGRYSWRGRSEEYVPMSDRYATFINKLARGLKERFPDRRLYVYDMAYGPNTPPPVKAVLEDNVVIGYVGYFPLGDEESRREQKEKFKGWAEKAPRLTYRPNFWYFAGGVWGLPEVAMAKTIEDFRFLAENHCVGLDVDTARGHWATQGPQYYMLAQLAWDPRQDGQAALADYYRRGFGPAAGEIERYWTLMEQAREAINAHPKHEQGSRYRLAIFEVVCEVFNPEFLARAEATLHRAEAAVAGSSDLHRQRVAFVRTGFEFTRKMFESASVMTRVRAARGRDAEGIATALKRWEEIEALLKRFPLAVNYAKVRNMMKPGLYMGAMQDYFGPPSEAFQKAASQPDKKTAVVAAPPKGKVKLVSAEKAGWRMAFHDQFDRTELGADWKILDGQWSIRDGSLVTSGGKLVTARGFTGFQRFEFEAVTDVKPLALLANKKKQPAVVVSDLSSFIQARPDGNPLRTGYFFQFGGNNNTCNRLLRAGVESWKSEDPTRRITPDKTHRIIVENHEGRLRFIVDGQLLHEEREKDSLVGEEQNRVGFYLYTAAKIRNVRIYIKPLDDGKI